MVSRGKSDGKDSHITVLEDINLNNYQMVTEGGCDLAVRVFVYVTLMTKSKTSDARYHV